MKTQGKFLIPNLRQWRVNPHLFKKIAVVSHGDAIIFA